MVNRVERMSDDDNAALFDRYSEQSWPLVRGIIENADRQAKDGLSDPNVMLSAALFVFAEKPSEGELLRFSALVGRLGFACAFVSSVAVEGGVRVEDDLPFLSSVLDGLEAGTTGGSGG